jgi:hypothetical protein
MACGIGAKSLPHVVRSSRLQQLTTSQAVSNMKNWGDPKHVHKRCVHAMLQDMAFVQEENHI